MNLTDKEKTVIVQILVEKRLEKNEGMYKIQSEDPEKGILIDGIINKLKPKQHLFTRKQLEKAYNDGRESEQQRCGEFDIDNYIEKY